MSSTLNKKAFFIKYATIIAILMVTSGMVICGGPKKRMKILMVVGSFPVIHDVCIINQITGLIDRGHDVRIYAFTKGDCTHVQEDVISYGLINKTIFKKLPKNLDDYDIVMFQFGNRTFDIKKVHNFKGKVVVCLRGYDITVFLKNNPHAYDNYFQVCDLFLPVCKAFKKILQTIGCKTNKIMVQHSAIDCSKFTFKKRKMPHDGIINIVSAGRFVEKKGFIYAIRAIAQIVKKYPRIRYTLIGEGVLKEEYEKLIHELDINDKVTIHSWHTHEEYIALLDQAHLFILPSVTAQSGDQEGIPNVLKEAMAMGLIVIGTNHSGNTELIEDGVSGFLVPEHDSNAIAHTIKYLISHSAAWPSIQLAAAYKVRAEFDKEKENDRLEAVLYKLLQKC